MNSIIKVNDLSFSYKNKKVLNNLSLNVSAGSIFALAGNNGAGKTTLMQILLGIFKPQKGSIMISGYNYNDLPKGKIGY